MAFLFSAPCTAEIVLDNGDNPTTDVKKDDETITLPLYRDHEPVKGIVRVTLKDGKKVEHNGITVQLLGIIDLLYDRGEQHEFIGETRELAAAGELTENHEFPFDFSEVEKRHESYNGTNVRLRYLVKFMINVKKSLTNVTEEQELWVIQEKVPPEINNSLKMEVGIEDTLHIEFEYNKAKYHMKDVIIGKIFFLLVRIKVKYMELCLIKRESTGSGPSLYHENETLTKFEIMDGAPVRGESIPVRLFLGGFDLTPTYRNVCTKFSLKYYLNLVLVAEDDRRYFKQQEVTLYRKAK
mmetsp:Transcript_14078/g.55437  ORF Transcript_14078/g.55437 Transcript_14078/m.55437 type:complete len:296 (+) Transcript_14078:68-955(+)